MNKDILHYINKCFILILTIITIIFIYRLLMSNSIAQINNIKKLKNLFYIIKLINNIKFDVFIRYSINFVIYLMNDVFIKII